MRTFSPPLSRVPAEVFYHPDGRLVIDYSCRQGDDPGRFVTRVFETDDTWGVIYQRPQTTPAFGQHVPWDACWQNSPFKHVGMTLVFQEKPPYSTLPRISAVKVEYGTLPPINPSTFIAPHVVKKAKWRFTTDFAENQRQAIKNLNFKGVHYGYYIVRAYRTGLWFDFLGNTVGGAQPRLVAKVRLKDGWWRDPWHPPSSHPGFQTEWTEYPVKKPLPHYSDAVLCPDMGRHYRVSTRCLFNSHGKMYSVPAGQHIVHAVVRGDVLAVSLASGNLIVSQHLKTIPRVSEPNTTVPASSVVFLDPDTLGGQEGDVVLRSEVDATEARHQAAAVRPQQVHPDGDQPRLPKAGDGRAETHPRNRHRLIFVFALAYSVAPIKLCGTIPPASLDYYTEDGRMIRTLGLFAALAATAIFAGDAQAFGRRGGNCGSSCGSGQVSYGGGGGCNSGGYSSTSRGSWSSGGYTAMPSSPSFSGGYTTMPSSGQWQPATFGGSTPYIQPTLSTPYYPPTIPNATRIPTQTYGSPIIGTPTATSMSATLQDGSTVNLIQTGTDQFGRPMYSIQPTTAITPAKPIIPPNDPPKPNK